MKYEPLRTRLQSLDAKNWTASFAELEQILGAALPASAHRHREWWANTTANVQARAWLDAGWQVESVYPGRRQVTFRRLRIAHGSGPVSPPTRAAASASEDSSPHAWDHANTVECGIRFRWRPIGRVTRDTSGKLSFPSVAAEPGLYRFSVRTASTQSVYVGETSNLQRRFQGYRTPGASQLTNVRLQKLLIEALETGAEIAVAIVTSAERLEVTGGRRIFDLSSKPVRVLLENAALLSGGVAATELLNRSSATLDESP